MLLSEARLIEKLRHIEALFAGATTVVERIAAEAARDRVRDRLDKLETETVAEYRFTMADTWSRKVFVALLRRHGVTPYRYKGQRYTTVMARVSKGFVDQTLWPQFQQFSDTLDSYLAEVTDRVVSQVLHTDCSDAAVIDKPGQLPLPMEPVAPAPPPASPSALVPPARPAASATAATSPQPAAGNEPESAARSGKRGRKKKKRRRRR